MDILLDTCVLLWWTVDDARVPTHMQTLLRDSTNRLFLSAASAWEIVIKHAAGRLPLPEPPGDFVARRRRRYQIEALPIEEEDALQLAKLPALHRDPFDRILVAQALYRGLVLATPDPLVRAYPCRTMW